MLELCFCARVLLLVLLCCLTSNTAHYSAVCALMLPSTAVMNSTKVQNPRRNSYAGTGCTNTLLRYPLHMRV